MKLKHVLKLPDTFLIHLSDEQIHLLSNKNIQDIVALLRPTLDTQYQDESEQAIILKSDTFDITIN